MGGDAQLDQGVAGPAAAWIALALQPQHLAVGRALGDGDVQRASVREGDAPLAALHRLFDAELDFGAHVAAALRLAAAEAEAGAAPAAAQDLRQDVAEFAAFEVPLEAAVALPAALEAARERAPGAERAFARAEAAHGLAPVRIDLAGVVLLALVLVAEDVERGRHLLEALLGRLVAGVLVRVQLLGQLAERLADLVGAGAPRHAEFLIKV